MNKPKKYQDQFKEVYLSNFSRMVRFALQYVISEEDAENIVQDIFLELWDKRLEFLNYANLKGYLFSLLKYRCIDFLRRKSIEQQITKVLQFEQQQELKLMIESLEALDENVLTNTDLDKTIHDAINLLPYRCKQIFIKNKLEGKKQKEIADELDISIHTVESQMSIAYKKIREVLKDLIMLFYIF